MAEHHYRDHDLDYPWTLFFNGQPMPQWANGWSLCNILGPAAELMQDWTSPVSFSDFVDLHDRMDLAHVTESEDPEVFRVCCLGLLLLLLRDEPRLRPNLAGGATDNTDSGEIFDGVRDGLALMHQLSLRDGMAVWRVGYDDDRTAVLEAIRCFKLPPTHPESREQPHIVRRRERLASRHKDLRRELLGVLRSQKLPKELRRIIHEGPIDAR